MTIENKKHYLNIRVDKELLEQLREYDNYSEFTRNALEKQLKYLHTLDDMTEKQIAESLRAIGGIINTTEKNSAQYEFFNLIASDFFRVLGNRTGMRKELI